MDTIDLNSIIQGLPSFFGLLFCVLILERNNRELMNENKRLIEAIIRGENCPEEIKPT
jgi:hypothetical protein